MAQGVPPPTGGGTTYTLIQQQPGMHSQHSASPPNGHNSSSSGGNSNQVAYHNKDERLQQIHKKLQKKLEKRDLNATGGGGSPPRKGTNNGNGDMIMHSTIPVSMVVGNKRNTVQHKQMNQQQVQANYQQPPPQFHPQHPQQQQQPHQHLNSHPRIVLSSTNSNNAGGVGRKVVTVLKSSAKKRMNGNGAANRNGGGSSIGTSDGDGEEGTSSVPEDEEYQLDVEDEIDGEMPQANGSATAGEFNGESGEGLNSVEEEVQHIKEQLSLVAGPKVSEILSRSALLQWVPPPNSDTFQFNAPDLFYEILLSDSAKYAKYKSIFKGQSLSCRIQDLKPGIEYSVCLRVHYQNVQGLESLTTIFNTVPCAPDAPLPPKLLTRSRNTLQLRWNVTTDNGAHIQHYVLEFDGGRGSEFIEVCRTKGKQYTLTKLTPSTFYR